MKAGTLISIAAIAISATTAFFMAATAKALGFHRLFIIDITFGSVAGAIAAVILVYSCLLYTSPSPRD